MRISALLIGFSAGAYLMWRVVEPTPVLPPSCLTDPACVVPQAIVAATTAPPRQNLKVVLYDPATDPSFEMEADPFSGPGVGDGLTISDRLDRPALPTGFRFVGLARPDARGVCAVFDGRKLQCVALLQPGDE